MVLARHFRRNLQITQVSEPVKLPGEANRSEPRMEQLIVISAVGGEPTTAVSELSRIIADCGGSIRESRMAAMGSEFGILLLVAGNWHTIGRLERDLGRYGEKDGISMQFKRTEARRMGKELLPYAVDVVGLDQPGIVHNLSRFFSARRVEIGEVSSRSYPAAHTGAPMFSVQMFVNIPSSVHIAGLREEFMEFCDQLNVDAIMEPVKQS
jgi:glycine cleavage system transcriptional repressor